MKKFSLMLIALFATTCVFAGTYNNTDNSYPSDNNYQDNCPPDPCCEPCPPTPCCDIPQAPTMPAYNAPARINVCGCWDFNIDATFLYWQANEEGLSLGYDVGNTEQITTDLGEKVYEFDFKYKPAFKVGIGYNMNYDNWSLRLQYTRFYSTQTTSTSLRSSDFTFRSRWLSSAVNNYEKMQSKWTLDFNIFDLDLLRTYYNGKHLILEPSFGLKGGWIDQKYIHEVSNPLVAVDVNPLHADFLSDSWLIGPRAGLKTKWFLGCGFNVIGNSSINLFYQKFNKVILQQQSNTNANLLSQNIKTNDQSNINSSFEYLLGLSYETYFNRNNYHFLISAGYESQIYFRQNEIRSQSDTATSTNGGAFSNPGDLSFHGLNLQIRFDF
ncbi:MAG: hypothetical protein JXA94_05990 [Parachlamydiales bacterium]|nr:hypothetical protein [Parachlamydiales bacterium]